MYADLLVSKTGKHMHHHVAKQMNSRGMYIWLFNVEDEFPKLDKKVVCNIQKVSPVLKLADFRHVRRRSVDLGT